MDAENFEICAQVKNLERWVNWGKNRESWITFFVVGGEKIIASQIIYFPKIYPRHMLVHFCKKMNVFSVLRKVRKNIIFLRDSLHSNILKYRRQSIEAKMPLIFVRKWAFFTFLRQAEKLLYFAEDSASNSSWKSARIDCRQNFVHFCKKMNVFYIMWQLRKMFVFLRDSYSIFILKMHPID